MLVPGGFGERGVEGKIAAVRFARENGMPYLGICLGMQVAVIEYARHVAGLEMPTARSSTLDAASGHRPDHRVAGRDGHVETRDEESDSGRHHAPGRPEVPLEPGSLARSVYGKPR